MKSSEGTHWRGVYREGRGNYPILLKRNLHSLQYPVLKGRGFVCLLLRQLNGLTSDVTSYNVDCSFLFHGRMFQIEISDVKSFSEDGRTKFYRLI